MISLIENYDLEKFEAGLHKLNVNLTIEQKAQFLKYYEMLVEKNKVMNLTGITEFDEVIDKHFLDSISLIQKLDLSKKCTIIDMGTGAGFPGLPLKIAFPELEITLADSLNKRVKFLNEVIDELGLTGITAVHGRAEELARKKEYREQFDYCVSRAVANLSSLSEYCLPFVKIGGSFVSYKSGDVQEELEGAKKAFKTLGGKIVEVFLFNVPNTPLNRSFIFIEKVKSTPKAYPRKAGTPTKEPL